MCHFKNFLHLLKVLRWRLHHNFPLQRREKENKKETHFCLNIDIQLIDDDDDDECASHSVVLVVLSRPTLCDTPWTVTH